MVCPDMSFRENIESSTARRDRRRTRRPCTHKLHRRRCTVSRSLERIGRGRSFCPCPGPHPPRRESSLPPRHRPQSHRDRNDNVRRSAAHPPITNPARGIQVRVLYARTCAGGGRVEAQNRPPRAVIVELRRVHAHTHYTSSGTPSREVSSGSDEVDVFVHEHDLLPRAENWLPRPEIVTEPAQTATAICGEARCIFLSQTACGGCRFTHAKFEHVRTECTQKQRIVHSAPPSSTFGASMHPHTALTTPHRLAKSRADPTGSTISSMSAPSSPAQRTGSPAPASSPTRSKPRLRRAARHSASSDHALCAGGADVRMLRSNMSARGPRGNTESRPAPRHRRLREHTRWTGLPAPPRADFESAGAGDTGIEPS